MKSILCVTFESMNNREIARQLKLLATLMDIHGENSFKANSYNTAAFNIKQLSENLIDIPQDDLFKIPGIGKAIGNKILEIRDKGSINVLNDLVAKTPPGIIELANIKGIGAKKIHDIWIKLDVEDPGELLYACNENRLIRLPGFGIKTQENIKKAVEYYLSQKGSFLFAQVESIAHDLEISIKKKTATTVALTGVP